MHNQERRRKLDIIEDSAGYLPRELTQAGASSATDDSLADITGESTFMSIRDAMYAQRLDDYLNMERSE